MAREYDIITNSSRNTFLECPEKHRLRNIVGIVAKTERVALVGGSWTHERLNELWEKRFCPYSYADAITSDPYQDARFRAMIRGYPIFWSDFLGKITKVQSEIPATIPLINPETNHASTHWRVGLVMDKFFRDRDGYYYIGEHKTSRDTSTGYFERLILDSQISTYLGAIKFMGLPEPRGILYDVLGKPQLRPLLATPVDKRKYTKDDKLHAAQRDTDETPAEYGQRCFEAIAKSPASYYHHQVSIRTEAETVRAQQSLWTTAAMIRECKKLPVWPQNTKACRNEFGGFCEYWPICSGREDDDSTLFEHRAPHEELYTHGELKHYD